MAGSKNDLAVSLAKLKQYRFGATGRIEPSQGEISSMHQVLNSAQKLTAFWRDDHIIDHIEGSDNVTIPGDLKDRIRYVLANNTYWVKKKVYYPKGKNTID